MNRHLCIEFVKNEKKNPNIIESQDTIEYLIAHYKEHQDKRFVIEKLPLLLDVFRKRSIFD